LKSPAGGGILLVDDDEAFRSFLGGLLESVGYDIRELATGAGVMRAVDEHPPAAILLDIRLPDLNGYEICRQVRDRYGDSIAIVFISGERTDALDRTGGLLLGADDYLVKPVDPGELVARIRRLVDRPQLSENGASANGKLDALTHREREVLELLADGMTQEGIATRLVISPKTVATHIQRILGKLEVRSRAQAVALVLREERDVTGHGPGDPVDLLDARMRRVS
jgi:two-component system OmpR family response regulator